MNSSIPREVAFWYYRMDAVVTGRLPTEDLSLSGRYLVRYTANVVFGDSENVHEEEDETCVRFFADEHYVAGPFSKAKCLKL